METAPGTSQASPSYPDPNQLSLPLCHPQGFLSWNLVQAHPVPSSHLAAKNPITTATGTSYLVHPAIFPLVSLPPSVPSTLVSSPTTTSPQELLLSF